MCQECKKSTKQPSTVWVSVLLVRNSDGSPRESHRSVGAHHPQLLRQEARPGANLTSGQSHLCQLPEQVRGHSEDTGSRVRAALRSWLRHSPAWAVTVVAPKGNLEGL